MKFNSWWTWFNLLVQKIRKLIFDFNTFNVWWDDKSWIIGDHFATRCLLSCQSWVLAAEKLLVHQDSLGEPVFSWLWSFWGLLFYEVLQGLLHVFSGHFQGLLHVFSGHFQGPLQVLSGHCQGPLQVFSGHFQGPLLQVFSGHFQVLFFRSGLIWNNLLASPVPHNRVQSLAFLCERIGLITCDYW